MPVRGRSGSFVVCRIMMTREMWRFTESWCMWHWFIPLKPWRLGGIRQRTPCTPTCSRRGGSRGVFGGGGHSQTRKGLEKRPTLPPCIIRKLRRLLIHRNTLGRGAMSRLNLVLPGHLAKEDGERLEVFLPGRVPERKSSESEAGCFITQS